MSPAGFEPAIPVGLRQRGHRDRPLLCCCSDCHYYYYYYYYGWLWRKSV